MTPRQKRLAIILGGVASVAIAAGLVLSALKSNVSFFYTPTQVASGEAPRDRAFRIGGLVQAGSIQRDAGRDTQQVQVEFVITDTAKDVRVRYSGILPDLFQEGKGAVAQGRLDENGRFVATEVLAKHDENYMPPEAKHAVDQAHKAIGKGAQ